MLRFISTCCEYVFPERFDYKLVRQAKQKDMKRILMPVDHVSFISLLDFKDPLVRAALHEAKFEGNKKAWMLLAVALSHYLKQQPPGTVVIPIPLSFWRHLGRGYNQVTEVAKRAVTENPHVTLENRWLYRQRHTKPQTSLKKEERFLNMTDAFCARDIEHTSTAPIIILDDVATTGATLKAAKLAVEKIYSGPIILLSLAH